MIQLNEAQRVAAYQSGWNDAAKHRAPQDNQPIMYSIGYLESSRGAPQRFVADLETTS